jgi:hypothetical protein
MSSCTWGRDAATVALSVGKLLSCGVIWLVGIPNVWVSVGNRGLGGGKVGRWRIGRMEACNKKRVISTNSELLGIGDGFVSAGPRLSFAGASRWVKVDE